MLLLIIPLTNLFIIVYNLFTAPRLSKNKFKLFASKVSILIPARNEEYNIENCLKHVADQSYKNLEIIVLDDFSNDKTFSKAIKMSVNDERIKVIKGKKLPDGWMGKNWACMQLSRNSSGDYLIFVDADVTLEKDAIESTIFKMDNLKTDMLSVFPKQVMVTFGEKVTVAFLNWLLLSFLPLIKVYSSKRDFYTAANGQFMLWKRKVYFETGGHESVKNKVVEDIELSRLLKKNGYKIITLLGDDLVSCRMYRGFKEALSGFIKNFFPASRITSLRFISILFVLVFAYIFPLIYMFDNILYISIGGIITLQVVLVSLLSRQNVLFNTLLFPLLLLVMFYIGLRSVYAVKSGNVFWKDRKL